VPWPLSPSVAPSQLQIPSAAHVARLQSEAQKVFRSYYKFVVAYREFFDVVPWSEASAVNRLMVVMTMMMMMMIFAGIVVRMRRIVTRGQCPSRDPLPGYE